MKKIEEWKKTFIKIYIGQSCSLITSSIVQYAIIWYLTYKTSSAMWLSIASLAGFLPQGILGLFIGSYIDKRNRKKIMIVSDIFISFVTLIMVIYAIFGELPILLILICLSLRSIGTAFHSPALQATLPLVVPQEDMLKYSGLSQSMQSISLIVSPAIAALLYDKIDMYLILFLDVIGVMIATFTLFISKIPSPKNANIDEVNIIKETIEGFKIIKQNKVVKNIFIISGFFILLYMPINSLFPLITTSHFKKSSFALGLIEISFAVGMLIGGLILGKERLFKNKKRNIIASMLIIAIAILITGLLPNDMFNIFIITSFFMGFSSPMLNASVNTIFAEQVKPDFLGRIYSNYMSLMVITMPIGLLLSGIFADKIGISIWFTITAILLLIVVFGIGINKNQFNKLND